MVRIHSPHPKVPCLGMNSKKPLPKRSRRTRPYPKQPPSPGEILAIGKPATQARMIGERTSFFEGALLPGTETGRAGVFSRTTHHDQRTILPRAAPTMARATITTGSDPEVPVPWTQVPSTGNPALGAIAQSLKRESQQYLNQGKTSLRQLSSLLGTMVAAHPAVLPAPLHYRLLE